MFERLYRHQLDAKNRMRIPAKFREDLGDNYVITCGTGGCLFVFKNQAMEELKTKLKKVSMFDAKKQDAIRFFLGRSWDAEEDGQGRILIPPALREYAGIDKNVITVGVFNRLEIWSEEFRKEAAKRKSYAERMKDLHERTM